MWPCISVSAYGRISFAVVVVFFLTCGSAPAGQVSLVLDEPNDGSSVILGQVVSVSSRVTADAGVTHAVLMIDGQVVSSDTPAGWRPTSCVISQKWTPLRVGRVVVSVVAFDRHGNSSVPVSIGLRVLRKGEIAPVERLDHSVVKAVAPYSTDKTINSTILAAGATGLVSAYCPTEGLLVGGGFASDNDVLFYGQLKIGNGWLGYAVNNGTESHTIQSYAVCLFNAPQASTSLVYGQINIEGGQKAGAIATCPAGTLVTGGGFHAYPAGDLRPYLSTKTATGESWKSWAENLTGSTLTHQAYAVCLSGLGGSTRWVAEWSPLVPPGVSRLSTPSCDPGEVLTSGGFAAEEDLHIRNSSGPWELDNDVWRVYGINTSSTTDRSFWGYAICATFGIFADGFESGDVSRWSASVP